MQVRHVYEPVCVDVGVHRLDDHVCGGAHVDLRTSIGVLLHDKDIRRDVILLALVEDGYSTAEQHHLCLVTVVVNQIAAFEME